VEEILEHGELYVGESLARPARRGHEHGRGRVEHSLVEINVVQG